MTLHPRLLVIYLRFMRLCREAGLNVVGYGFWRSPAAQRLMHQRRLSRHDRSFHEVLRGGRPAALAYDVIVIGPKKLSLPKEAPEWLQAGLIGEDLGLTWGGRWGDDPRTPAIEGWDLGHFQLDDGGELTLAAALEGTDPEEVET